ncbi:MAG: triose-phosphate isomerase [Candidatus Diapherotrites archaeon]|nr:triose-phosphate isomerase [Candidatus Diapherotrites archaeon]
MVETVLPRIIVNFKAYRESLGGKGLEIAKAAERVEKETGVSIGVAPQFVDLRMIASAVGVPVFAQHVDPLPPGAHTGAVTVEAVTDSGAIGSLLNHSERPMKLIDIEKAVEMLREKGLISVVCASDPRVGKAAADLGATAVAVEPPELIGTGVSVSRARPEVIERSVKEIRAPVYVGAGVSTSEDVRRAIELGAHGVLLASAVVKAKDPYRKLLELAEGVITAEE